MIQQAGAPQQQHIPTDRTDVAKYLLLFTLLWLLLTQGNLHSLVIGILVIPLATWAAVSLRRSVAVQHNPAVKIAGLVRFLPFFFWQSLRGGWETSMFAIHPGRRLSPGFVSYRTQLPMGRPRLCFLHLISLLPGTVSAATDGPDIVIHALNMEAGHQQALAECEQQVAMVFAIRLATAKQNQSYGGGSPTTRKPVL